MSLCLDKSEESTFLRFAARFCGVKTSSAAHGDIRLKVGNVVIHQPNTIVRYFARTADRELELCGENPLEKTEISHWIDIATTLRSKEPLNISFQLEGLDKTLISKVYFVGNRPTLADATLYWGLYRSMKKNVSILSKYTNLRRWFNQIQHTVGVRGFPDVELIPLSIPSHVVIV